MKGLSLIQPWASLVALGAKTIETRSWWTPYRGEILIHASKQFPADAQSLCRRDPFAEVLIGGGYDRPEKLPRGVVITVAVLEACIATNELGPFWEKVASRHGGLEWSAREQAFGDFSPNRYAWYLSDVRALRPALPASHVGSDGRTKPGGALGLWSVPQVLLDLVAGQGVLA